VGKEVSIGFGYCPYCGSRLDKDKDAGIAKIEIGEHKK